MTDMKRLSGVCKRRKKIICTFVNVCKIEFEKVEVSWNFFVSNGQSKLLDKNLNLKGLLMILFLNFSEIIF
jgi:hypothetical protein